jgi:hypothetical protein
MTSRMPDAIAGAVGNAIGRNRPGLAALGDGAGGDALVQATPPTPGPSGIGDPAGIAKAWRGVMPLFRRVLEKQDRAIPANIDSGVFKATPQRFRAPGDFGRIDWADLLSTRKPLPGGPRRFGQFGGDTSTWTPPNPVAPVIARRKQRVGMHPVAPDVGFDAEGIGTGRHSFSAIAKGLAGMAGLWPAIGRFRDFAAGARNAAYSAHGHARYQGQRFADTLERGIDAVWAAPGRAWRGAKRFGSGVGQFFTSQPGQPGQPKRRPLTSRQRARQWRAAHRHATGGFQAAFAAHRGMGPGFKSFFPASGYARAKHARAARAIAATSGITAAAGRAGLALGALAGVAARVAGPIGIIGSVARAGGNFAEEQNQGNRRFAAYSGPATFEYARLGIHEMMRTMKIGRDNEGSIIGLTRSVDRMRFAFVEFDSLKLAVGNRVGIAGAEFAGAIGRGLAPASRAIHDIIDTLDPGGSTTAILSRRAGGAALGSILGGIGGGLIGLGVAGPAGIMPGIRIGAGVGGVAGGAAAGPGPPPPPAIDLWADQFRQLAIVAPIVPPKRVRPPRNMRVP